MNKKFTKNLPWKIASVLFAFVLWLFVINTQNPTQPQEISGVRVVINGLEKLESQGYELTNKDEILKQNFKIVVNGPRLETDNLVRNPHLITATLNLNDYMDELTQDSVSDVAIYSILINTDGNAVSVKDKNPQVTKVIIDKKETKTQKITYEIDKSITDQYTLLGDGKPVITPDTVELSGAKTEIDKVQDAKVFITADDFNENQLVSKLPIRLFDAEGNDITKPEISPSSVEVKLPIGIEKTVPLKLDLQGKMADGYQLVNTMVSPGEVKIVGKADVIRDIKEIKLAPIDLSTVTKSDFIETSMILPDGVITLGEAKATVSLEVVEENSLSYPIQTSELNLKVNGIGDGLSYEIITPSINVVLSALPNKLLSYLTSDIKAELNLKGYDAGEYTLPLTIIPPEGAKVVNSPININVRITRLKQEEAPAHSSTNNSNNGNNNSNSNESTESPDSSEGNKNDEISE